jgi:hypothetical protein
MSITETLGGGGKRRIGLRRLPHCRVLPMAA